jgi:hypothetical protein
MSEKDRPLLVKLIFWGSLLSGIGGIALALLGPDEQIQLYVSESLIGRMLLERGLTIDRARVLITILSFVSLWYGYVVFALKRIAWHIMFWNIVLGLLVLLSILIGYAAGKASLRQVEKIVIFGSAIVQLFLYGWIRSSKDHFIY